MDLKYRFFGITVIRGSILDVVQSIMLHSSSLRILPLKNSNFQSQIFIQFACESL